MEVKIAEKGCMRAFMKLMAYGVALYTIMIGVFYAYHRWLNKKQDTKDKLME